MRTTNTYRTLLLVGTLLVAFSGPVNAASYSTDTSISGTTPTSSYSYGNHGWLNFWTDGSSSSSVTNDYLNASSGGISVRATGTDSTPSDQVSLTNFGVLSVQNLQPDGPGPWSSSFASASMKSGLGQIFGVGSYSAQPGTAVDGVLKIDLDLDLNYFGSQPTLAVNAILGHYLSWPGIDLFVGSSMSATLQSWGQTYDEFTGFVWLNADSLDNSGHASTILEIPFSTTVGSSLLLQAELVTNFLATWNPGFVYSQWISISSHDPIVLEFQTPDAYFTVADSGYYGPDQFVSRVEEPGGQVDEPSVLALMLIGLPLLRFRKRLKK